MPQDPTIEELGRMAGVSFDTMYRLRRLGKLPGVYWLGGEWRISWEAAAIVRKWPQGEGEGGALQPPAFLRSKALKPFITKDLIAPYGVSTSLDELIEQQGVSPVDDLDEIAALWPGDDDPDKFLRHLLVERGKQRRLTRVHRSKRSSFLGP